MNRNLKTSPSQKQQPRKKSPVLKAVHPQVSPQQTRPDNGPGLPAASADMAVQLTASYFQTAQRQMLVRQINRTQGNRYIQRMLGQIQRWPDTETADSVTEIIDTANSDSLETLLASFETGVNGQSVVLDLPNRSNITIPIEEATSLRQQTVKKLSERLMEDVAMIVLPAAARMDAATSSSQRRELMMQIHSGTADLLTRIATLRPGSERWKHPNPAVQDSILAALQIQVIFRAEAYFTSTTDQEAPGGAHHDAFTTMGGAKEANWCGMFVSTNYLYGNFDSDLKNGFRHVDNVFDYFNYVYRRNPKRVKKWIYVDDRWQELRAYHESRDSLRQWTEADSITSAEGLDIQPGDIVLLDNDQDGQPNHIVMVHTWNPTTKMLFTIGGNDGGFRVDQGRDPSDLTEEDEATMRPRDQAELALDQPLRRGGKKSHVGIKAIDVTNTAAKVRVFGIGRPSIVDFEDHPYHTDKKELMKPPVDVPGI